MKRIISMFLSVVMLAGLAAGLDFSAVAEANGTQAAAQSAKVQSAGAQDAETKSAEVQTAEAQPAEAQPAKAQSASSAAAAPAAVSASVMPVDGDDGEDGEDTHSGTDNNGIKWSFDSETETLKFELPENATTTLMSDYSSSTYNTSSCPWYKYKDSIKHLVIGYGITGLGNYSFYQYTALESVEVETQEDEDGIERTTLQQYGSSTSNYTFNGCTGITTMKLPANIKYNAYDFKDGCSAVTDVTLVATNGSTYGGYVSYAYDNNTSYSSKYAYTPWYLSGNSKSSGGVNITLLRGITNVVNYTFYQTYILNFTAPCDVLYGGTATITNTYFKNIQKVTLTQGTASDTVNVISSGTTGYTCTPWYIGRSYVTAVELNDSVTGIGNYAFYSLSKLESIDLSNVTEIGTSAFYGCTALASITLNTAVSLVTTANTNNSFYNCTGVTKLTITGGPIPDYELDSASDYYYWNSPWYDISLYSKNGFEVVLDDGVTEIGDYAFYNCPITGVNLSGVTAVGDYAFYADTDSLTSSIASLDLTSVETVGTYAFYGLESAADITVGSAAQYIGQYAFAGTAFYNNTENWADGVLYIGTCAIAANESEMPGEYSIREGTTLLAAYSFYGCSSVVLTVPDSVVYINEYALYGCNVKEITLPEETTAISACAFYGCTGLEAITIPESVAEIGEYAFYGCTALESIDIPAAVTAIAAYTFYSCASLTEITLPESVAEIGEYAFYGCTALESIDIPAAVTAIAAYTFYNCASLAEITLPESVTGIGEYAFYNCAEISVLDIPAAVTEIGEYAFAGLGITAVSLPEAVTALARGVFENCESLAGVTLAVATTEIGGYAFYGCAALEKISLPESVSTIGEYAFARSGLTEISLPQAVTEIAAGTFNGCRALTSFEIGSQITSIGSQAFSAAGLLSIEIPVTVTGLGTAVFSGCSALEEVTFEAPAGVTAIPDEAFNNCTAITAITIPAGVETIGSKAFNGCVLLAGLDLGEVTGIGSNAFYNCKVLDNVVIPATCETVGSFAFAFCTKLADLTISAGVASIGDYAFQQNPGLETVTIPASVTDLGAGMFNKCVNLREVVFETGEETGEAGFPTLSEYMFYGCTALESIEIPAGVTTVGASAFENSGLTEITLPDSVATLGTSAFAGCTALESVSIGSGLKTLGSYAFDGCTSLQSITVSEDNEAFAAVGNVLFTEDMTTIKLYPNGLTAISYEVPETVTTIVAGAFVNSSLQSVVLPATVETVEAGAFSGCGAITDVAVLGFDTAIGDSETTFGTSGAVTVHGEIASGAYTYAAAYDSVSFDATDSYNCAAGAHLYFRTAVAEGFACQQPLETTYTCVLCDEETEGHTYTTTEQADHSWDGGAVTTDPTCTEAGVITYTCTVCGETRTEPVSATGHDWVLTDSTPATCVAFGTETYTCTHCGESYTVTGTEYGEHAYEAAVTAPTCTDAGYTDYTCTVCGDAYTAGYTDPTGHDWAMKYKVKATTDQKGTVLYTCASCGETNEAEYAEIGSMSLSTTIYAYDGNAKTPAITVKDKNGGTIASDWYCVQYYSYKTAGSVGSITAVGKYYVKITFRTKYAGSLTADVTVNPAETQITALSSDSSSFTVKVKQAAGEASGYQVQYAKNTSFSGGATVNLSGSTTTTKRVTGLASGTYYARVRTYAKVKVNGQYQYFYSAWSTGKSVKVGKPAVTLSANTYVYNGKAKTPTVTVKDVNGNKLSSSDYTVSYISRATGKTVSSMKSVGKYYVKVTLKGNYSGSFKKAVKIKPKATSINSVTAASKGFTVKWGKVTSCTTGYQIQYSTSASFSGAKTKTITDNTATSKKITGLKANKKYYVRVRTYKTVKVDGKSVRIHSSWSSVKTVTTKK